MKTNDNELIELKKKLKKKELEIDYLRNSIGKIYEKLEMISSLRFTTMLSIDDIIMYIREDLLSNFDYIEYNSDIRLENGYLCITIISDKNMTENDLIDIKNYLTKGYYNMDLGNNYIKVKFSEVLENIFGFNKNEIDEILEYNKEDNLIDE